MIGFTVPVHFWPASEDEDSTVTYAVVTWDDDSPDGLTLDIRLPANPDGSQAIINVAWADVQEAADELGAQNVRRLAATQKAAA